MPDPQSPSRPSDRERDAVALLDRIYGKKAGYQLHDDGMVVSWIDEEIMAFIRKWGSFPDQFREMDRAGV